MIIETRTKEEYYHRVSQVFNATGIDYGDGDLEFGIINGYMCCRNVIRLDDNDDGLTAIASPWEVLA